VAYRTSIDPQPKIGKLKYADKQLQFEEALAPGSGDGAGLEGTKPAEQFEIKNVTQVQERNYAAGLSFDWGLVLTMRVSSQEQPPPLRHSFIFQRMEERDMFVEKVRELMSRQTRRQAQKPAAEEPENKPCAPKRVISKVSVLETPAKEQANEAIAFRLELDPPPEEEHLVDNGGKADFLKLSIPDIYYRDVKDFVTEWSKKHNIHQAEATSLYRLVKALLDRKHVKGLADDFKKKIDEFDFDRHAAGELSSLRLNESTGELHMPFTALTDAEICGDGNQLQVNRALQNMKKTIRESRLGESSSMGAFLVRGLLDHNIERKKAINTHLALQRYAAHEAHKVQEQAKDKGILDGGLSLTGRRRRNLAPKLRTGKDKQSMSSASSTMAALPPPP